MKNIAIRFKLWLTPPMRFHLAAAALLVAAIAAVYWQTHEFGFVQYDDPEYVGDNEQVSSGITRDGVVWAFSRFHDGNWIPLTWLSLMADVELHRSATGRTNSDADGPGRLTLAGQIHLTNALLHVANAILLYATLMRLTSARWKSAVVALLFAVHPLHVESVAWVAERKDVLSAFFGMLSLIVYVGYTRHRGALRYAVALSALGLSLMAKPMLVTLPFVFLLLDCWPLQRRFSRRLLFEKVPFLALSIAACAIAIASQSAGDAIAPLAEIPLRARVANAVVSYVAYMVRMFWPAGLGVLYPHFETNFPWPHVAGAAALLAAVTWTALLAVRRCPYLLVGWLWYLGTLLPVIGFVQIGAQRMADRYTYFPLVGLFVAVVWLVEAAASTSRCHRSLVLGTTLVVIAAFGQLAVLQTRSWRDSLSLFSQTIRATGDNAIMYGNVAHVLRQRGRLPAAIRYYQKAIEIDPQYIGVHNDLAHALREAGRLHEAIAQYREVLQATPDHAATHNDLGVVLQSQGRLHEAVTEFRAALRFSAKPTVTFNAAGNLAWLLATSDDATVRDAAAAVKLAEFANELSGGTHPQALDILAAAYAADGRFELAVQTARKAYELSEAAGLTLRAASIRERLALYESGRPYRQSFGPPASSNE